MSEQRQVAIVTGASRGAGRGIARALGAHGWTVYVAGRSAADGDADMPGTIHSTAREVTEAGGRGIGPAYGAHKAGVDKMAFDMGVDFADAGANVAAVSIWMGALTTERLVGMMDTAPDRFAHLEGTLESPDYTGHVAWAIYNDPDMMRFNGRTIIGAEEGARFGITDIGGLFHLQCARRRAPSRPSTSRIR